MQERLLQFIWQEKYFNTTSLRTVCGEPIVILESGILNKQQGPDFTNARILRSGTLWAGNIEVHHKSSHWHQHRHNLDPNYNTVILHVVWEDDDPKLSKTLPTLVLQHLVPSLMINRYAELMQQKNAIACHSQLKMIDKTFWSGWMEELLMIRLQRKSKQVLERLEATKNNWEECCWRWISRQFGGPVNAAFFEEVAKSIPVNIVNRHRKQVIQLEALFLGQGNLLGESNADPYVQLLQREYRFLKNKYRLPPVHGQAQLLRMRPAGFPTIRFAQLAMLMNTAGHLFSTLLECNTTRELGQILDVTANDFWHYHYTLEDRTVYHPKHLGSEMIHQLIINGIAPLIYTVGLRQQHSQYKQLAINWLKTIPPEKNAIQRAWTSEGINAVDASQSQALNELKNCFCSAKRCLDCSIGKLLLNRS